MGLDQHPFEPNATGGVVGSYCVAVDQEGRQCGRGSHARIHGLDGAEDVPGVPGGDRAGVLRLVGDGGGGPADGGPDPAGAAAHDEAPAYPAPREIHRTLWRMKVTDPDGGVTYTAPRVFQGPFPGFAVSAEYGWTIEMQTAVEVVQQYPWTFLSENHATAADIWPR